MLKDFWKLLVFSLCGNPAEVGFNTCSNRVDKLASEGEGKQTKINCSLLFSVRYHQVWRGLSVSLSFSNNLIKIISLECPGTLVLVDSKHHIDN